MPEAITELILSRPDLVAGLMVVLILLVILKGLWGRNSRLEQDVEHWRQHAASLENRLAGLDSDLESRKERLAQLESERQSLQAKADELSGALGEARVSLREQEVTIDKERRSANEKLELLERNRDALKQEFENLANKIFDQKSERFSQQTRTSLDTLLNPFRDQLQDFRKRVEDVYTTETRDRQALRSEIKSLQDLNRQITEEASNLTRALKGDKKIQGNWGELILERVLEKSGLRKGWNTTPRAAIATATTSSIGRMSLSICRTAAT